MKKILIPIILMGVLICTRVQAFYYWDTNGSSPGAGGPDASGTWGVDSYWNDATFGKQSGSLGTGETVQLSAGSSAAFAAGIGTVQEATGPYIVTVNGNIQVGDIHVDYGDVTIQGGSLNLIAWDGKGNDRLFSVGGFDPDAIARYNTVLTGATNIIRYKRGTLILSATNTYTGSTTIEGGILQLGASQVIPTNSNLILINNTTNHGDFHPSWQFTPSVLATDGFSQKFGTLLLTGTDPSVERIIDFGNGASALSFADSSGENWTNGCLLTVMNYTLGTDSLRFGNSSAGLTSTQLGMIQFVDYNNLPGQIDSNGFVMPAVPVFRSVHRTPPSNVELIWSALIGHSYRVQYKDNLNDPGWTDLTPDVTATGDTATITDTTATLSKRFYRVQMMN